MDTWRQRTGHQLGTEQVSGERSRPLVSVDETREAVAERFGVHGRARDQSAGPPGHPRDWAVCRRPTPGDTGGRAGGRLLGARGRAADADAARAGVAAPTWSSQSVTARKARDFLTAGRGVAMAPITADEAVVNVTVP